MLSKNYDGVDLLNALVVWFKIKLDPWGDFRLILYVWTIFPSIGQTIYPAFPLKLQTPADVDKIRIVWWTEENRIGKQFPSTFQILLNEDVPALDHFRKSHWSHQ